ncbi:MAG: helix-turn-helix transcriptional regulator [Dehalococcoidales bacterium]|nr:helix-turn-helix transcriptional regulator [Dehalococcoidales bacterium]
MSEYRIPSETKAVIRPSYEWLEDARKLGISRREVEVFALLVEGHNNKEAAAILGIQYQSVKNHWHSLSKKIKAKNLGQAYMILSVLNVVGMNFVAIKGEEREFTHEDVLDSIRRSLRDEDPNTDKSTKKAVKKFFVDHGLYGEIYKDRARELRENENGKKQ